jgi:hypothetical protein
MPTPKGRAWREALSGPPGPVNQSGGQCGRARASVVAAADERLAMPSEDWIQHSIVARVLYDWQTLIAGLLAVLAAWRTIRATTNSADREVAAFQPVGVFPRGPFRSCELRVSDAAVSSHVTFLNSKEISTFLLRNHRGSRGGLANFCVPVFMSNSVLSSSGQPAYSERQSQQWRGQMR